MATDAGMQTALHKAAAAGEGAICSALMEFGANPQLVDAQGLRPFDLAVMAGHAYARRMIVALEADNA